VSLYEREFINPQPQNLKNLMATVIRKQKIKKKGITFNLMVVGPSGSGKTTFINTLCEDTVMPRKDYSDPQTVSQNKTVSISTYNTGT
jgi:septin family protein